MRFLRALLLFLPMPSIGVALCAIGPLAARTALQAWLPIAPTDRPWIPAWQSMPSPPPWAPSATLEWREELDGSEPLGFVAFDDPTQFAALADTWGVQVEGHMQTNAYFATHGPSPPLDDLIALIVFDQPHWLGPFHERRMRSFHVADGQAVEVPELTATLGNYHPCGTANALGAHLTEGVPDATLLVLHAADAPDRAIVWPTATDAQVARRIDPWLARRQLLWGTGALVALLGHLVPGTLGWLWWRRRRPTPADRPLPPVAWLAFLATMLWVRQPVVLALSLLTVAGGHSLRFPETDLPRVLAMPWWSFVGPAGLLGAWICLSAWWALPPSERIPVVVGGLLGSIGGAAALSWVWTALST